MNNEQLNKLYEEAKRREIDKSYKQEAYIERLDKLIAICRKDLLPKPKRKWFKKVCPCCELELNKKIRRVWDLPSWYWRYTHHTCFTSGCNYEWADRKYRGF